MSSDRVLMLEPEPTNVTPADTTSQYGPGLAETIRQFHGDVTGIIYPHDPDATDIAGIIDRAREDDIVMSPRSMHRPVRSTWSKA